jgi:hypothetical protein
MALRPFKPCKGGCGRYGDYPGGICDGCRRERTICNAQATALARETKQMNNQVGKDKSPRTHKVS